MRRPALLLGSGLMALALAACQSKPTPQQSEQKAESAVCANLAAVGEALEAVGELGPTSTVGDAEQARNNLAKAVAKLQDSEAALEKLRIQELQKQVMAFNKDVKTVTANKSTTLQEAANELQGKLEPVLAARQAAVADVNCDGGDGN